MIAIPAKASPIPFISEPPLIGSIRALEADRLGFLEQLARKGAVCGFHLGPLVTVIMLSDPWLVQSFMDQSKLFDKGRTMRRAFRNNSIFITEGEVHRRQRKLMAPSFQPRHISTYADTMVAYTERQAAGWRDGQEIDLNRSMSQLTLRIIGKTLFDDEDFSATDGVGSALIQVGRANVRRVTNPLAQPLSRIPTRRHRAERAAQSSIRARILQMIAERREHHSEQRTDLLSVLMQARDEDNAPMSDAQLIDECQTIFSGGQESVSNTLCWTWYLLCQHPDIYHALQTEVDTVLQGRPPTYADLKQLPGCLQIIKEALRLYPPAVLIVREALQDCVLSGQEERQYAVKKGATVMASIYAIHRMPSLYPAPSTFDPFLHFAPEAESQLPRYGFMPFGGGPHICIGNHFAMMEAQLILATQVGSTRFELVPGQDIRPSSRTLTNKPASKMRMIVRRRGSE
jgi:cytochrome P450